MTRAIASGEAELSDMAAGISEVEGRVAALEAEAEEKQGDIQVRPTNMCDAAAQQYHHALKQYTQEHNLTVQCAWPDLQLLAATLASK